MFKQGLHRMPHMLNRTLDDFDCYGSEALIRRKAFADIFLDKDRDFNFALFFGAPGTGKTHLAVGIMREWMRDGKIAIFWPFMRLLGHLRELMNPGKSESPDQYIDFLCNFQGLLILDEIGRSKGETWDRDSVLYPLLDRRQDKPTIMISNFNLEELAQIYDDAIASRLKSGQLVSFPGELINDHRRN